MYNKIDQIQLSSSSILLNVTINNFPVSIFSAWFLAGSRFDSKGKEGLAHLFEHLIGKNIKQFSQEVKRLENLEFHGIKYNASTNYETSLFYHIQSPDKSLTSIDHLLNGIFDSVFEKKDLEEEKKIIKEERDAHHQNSSEYLWNYANQKLWPNSPLGSDFFGRFDTIRKIDIDDCSKFFDERYLKGKKVFIFIGNEKTEEIKKLIIKKIRRFIENEIQENIIFERSELLSIKNNKENHANIAVSFRNFSQNDLWKDIISANFIQHCLSEGWASKLNKKLRLEKNLVYWVNGETVNFSDQGFIRFIFSCDLDLVKKTLKLFFEEINNFKTKILTEKELNAYKNFFKTSFLMNLTDPYELMWYYGWQMTVGLNKKVLLPEEYLAIVENLTAEDILKAANVIFDKKRLSVVILGDILNENIIKNMINEVLG